jgi:predicted ATPase
MNAMSSPSITTIVKMVESLPDELQEQVVEHVRAYLAELEDEKRWDSSFKRTQNNLVAAARKAKAEITAGHSMPMDYEQL